MAERSGRLLLPALELYICCDELPGGCGFAGELGPEVPGEERLRESSRPGRRASARCSFVDALPMSLRSNARFPADY